MRAIATTYTVAGSMFANDEFRRRSPEFWALVKLISQEVGYSIRPKANAPSRIRTYSETDILRVLDKRGLRPEELGGLARDVSRYTEVRAELLHSYAETNLMNREQACGLFEELRDEINPPDILLPLNKQRGVKRHFAYLTGCVNMLTWQTLIDRFGRAEFDSDPRGPLTFSRNGMPLRTLFRRMDGAYPGINHPYAAWEIKEYYGTTTFGSRVADGVYESALDGYELNDLRNVGVEVAHYLFIDDYYTWWECGKSYLCRIVDMLHADLLDGAFVGMEVASEWPSVVKAWPSPDDLPAE
jgi:hypothetical protein